MSRIAVALFALLALTAFAPAPFPKTQRSTSTNDITLDSFQGTWRIVSLDTVGTGGTRERGGWDFTHVRITRTRWDYLTKQQLYEAEGRRFALDPTKKPAHFHFVEQSGPQTITGPGIIRRKGNVVEIIYHWGEPGTRCRDFESPTVGHWYLTLERER